MSLEIRCELPSQFDNGKFVLSDQSSGNNYDKSAMTSVRIGSKIVFSCHNGFYMDGTTRLECLEVYLSTGVVS